MKKFTVFCLIFCLAVSSYVFSGGTSETGKKEAEPTAELIYGKYREAPMLAALVKAGKLPPVEERLPKNPKVIKPMHEIGKYGGTLRKIKFSGSGGMAYTTQEAISQFTWDLSREIVGVSGVEPNIADRVEFSADYSSVTIHLREGLKWSNGDPFTTEDFRFRWEDLWLNKDWPENVNGYLKLEGKAPKLEVINDYTFKFTWHATFPAAEKILAWGPGEDCYVPSAFYKKYHPKYNSEYKDYDALIKKIGGIQTQLHTELAWPELPTMTAWDVIEYTPGKGFTAERNPYYYQVDTEGNQLPYIDRIIDRTVADQQMAALKVAQGEVDAQGDGELLIIQDVTLFKENEKKGNYKMFALPEGRGKAIYINRYTPKPELYELFRNPKFRIALSVAYDRESANKFIYKGLGIPIAYTYNIYSPYFSKKVGKMHTEYDPAKANRLLDELGLKDTNGDGIREHKNGKPVEILAFVAIEKQDMIDIFELGKKYWRAVGIDLVIKTMKRSVLYPKLAEYNLHDITIWNMGGATEPLIKGGRWAPVDQGGGKYWCGEAYEWYVSGGKKGKEPDGELMHVLKLYTAALKEGDSKRRDAMMVELGDFHAKEAMNIGIVTPPVPFILNNDIGNARAFVFENTYNGISLIKPQQFYYKK